MNLRSAILEKPKWLIKTDNGRVVLILAVIAGVLLYLKVTGTTISGKDRSPSPSQTTAAVATQEVETQTQIVNHQSTAPLLVGHPNTQPSAAVHLQTSSQMLPIDSYTANIPAVSDQFAPYGRLIRCKLVNTLESNNSDTPIIGLVMEDVDFNGQCLMKAGVTEIHGTINTSRVRDRINSNKQWIAVWSTRSGDEQNGEELPFQGIALAYAPNADELGKKWELIDGSAGLKGYTIDTTDLQKLLMIAAAFVQGAGQGLTTSTVFEDGGGSTTSYDGSLKSGAAQGFSKAAEILAQSMLDDIRKNGAYVRVPAGTMFYVYITQTLDLTQARIGASNTLKTKSNQ